MQVNLCQMRSLVVVMDQPVGKNTFRVLCSEFLCHCRHKEGQSQVQGNTNKGKLIATEEKGKADTQEK